jgi:hypothetical protein
MAPASAPTRAAATTSVRPPSSTATYSWSGWTATATLAGSVHGVVVQIAAAGAARPASGAGSGSTNG